MRIWWLLGCISLVLGLALPGCQLGGVKHSDETHADSEAKGFVTNIYGQRLSWKGQTPVRIDIHESVAPEVIPVLQRAMDDWKSAMGKTMFEVGERGMSGPKALEAMRDGHNTIYVFGSGEWKGRPEDQAKTYISWTRNQIQEADIVINADTHQFALSGKVAPGEVDLESVLVHELGHVLGLDHQDSGTSVMAAWLPEGQTRRTVFKSDLANLRSEYP